MLLFPTVAIVAVLIYSNDLTARDIDLVDLRLLLIGITVCLPHHISPRRRSLSTDTKDDATTQRLWTLIHFAVWCVCCILILGPLKWVQIVRFHFELDGLFLLDELLILLPLVFSWNIIDLIRQLLWPQKIQSRMSRKPYDILRAILNASKD